MVNVIGLGYIGLPTALMLSSHGIEVVGTDYNKDLVDTLNEGFDKDFLALSNKMSELTDSWLDLEGEHFKNVFVSFMTDAKKINDCVVQLGQFATEMSTSYQTTLNEHANELNRALQ